MFKILFNLAVINKRIETKFVAVKLCFLFLFLFCFVLFFVHSEIDPGDGQLWFGRLENKFILKYFIVHRILKFTF